MVILRNLGWKGLSSVISTTSSAFKEDARRPDVIGPDFLERVMEDPSLVLGAFEGGHLAGFLIARQKGDAAI
ncbi:MAG: hypothetical protein ACP5T2_06975, partial [Thermoprotei archaeon]